MNNREFEELCSEYERQLSETGKDVDTVKEFFQYCKHLNTEE